MKPFLKLQSADEILAKIGNAAALEPETVPLDEAAGRYLAKDFIAPENLPGFDRSRVDGFAVRAEDIFGASETSPAFLKLAEDCPMGSAVNFELRPGEAARILTGGMLPKNADCAVMVEYSRPCGDNNIEITHSQAPGDNIVHASDDAEAGKKIIAQGKCLRPQEIGLLAAFGKEYVSVCRKPQTAVLSTGDELVPFQCMPAPGQVRDVNSHSLMALLREKNMDMDNLGIIRDDFALLQTVLANALPLYDVIAVSGGSSAGMRDHTLEAFMNLPDAELLAHGAAISPGKPFILVKSGNKYLFGLPGHVTSALICARIFLLPLLRAMQGSRNIMEEIIIKAILDKSAASAQGRRDYIRCRLEKRDGKYHAMPIGFSSAVISSLVEADGLVICPETLEGLKQGSEADVLLFS